MDTRLTFSVPSWTPACSFSVATCTCIGCHVQASKRRCRTLEEKARESKKTLEEGKPLSLAQLNAWWVETPEAFTMEADTGPAMISANAELSTQHPIGGTWVSEAILQDDSNSKVELVRSGEELLVRKTIPQTTMEALVHKELCDTLEGTPLSGFVPRFRGMRLSGEEYELYMEHVEGPTLHEVMSVISLRDFDRLVSALHGFLALLGQIGFLHGDLHTRNIILRDYGKGKRYEVPIAVGSLLLSEELSFFPVLVDFGHSVTHRHHMSSLYHGPYLNEMVDVIRFYTCLGKSQGDGSLPSEKVVALIGRVFDTENMVAWVPIPLLCDQLTHTALQRHYVGVLTVP